jgi:hypothetical protein
MHLNLAVVAAGEDLAAFLVHCNVPNPVVNFTDGAEQHAVAVPQCDLLVTTSDGHVVTLGEEGDRARVEAEVFVIADLLRGLAALNLVQ